MKLYLVKMTGRESDESFYKVGVTKYPNTMHRFTRYGEDHLHIQNGSGSRLEKLIAAFGGHVYQHPYSVTLVHEVAFETEADAMTTEAEILEAVFRAKYVPIISFSGLSECFKATDEQIKKVIEYMDLEAAEARGSSTSHEK